MTRLHSNRNRCCGGVFTVLVMVSLLAGCSDDDPGSPYAVPPEGLAREVLEQPGSVAFSEGDEAIANTSGKGGPVIEARSYIPDDAGLYPLVIFLPGFGATYDTYAEYSRHFASHGMAVLAISFAYSDTFSFDGEHDLLLIQVRDAVNHALTRFSDKVDPAALAVMGHSLGGKMAFYAAAALNGSAPDEPQLRVAIGLDPVNSGGPPCFIAPEDCIRYPVAPNPEIGEIGLLDAVNAASLILRSEPDPATNPDAQFNAALFYNGYDGAGLNAVPAPALYLDLGAASHVSYSQPGGEDNPVPLLGMRTALAWLLKYLQDANNVDPFLGPDYLQQDIDSGLVQSLDSR